MFLCTAIVRISNMPRFGYKAKEGPGKVIDGVVEAQNIDSAINKIIELGCSPLDVFPAADETKPTKSISLKSSFQFLKKVPLSDKVLFTRQLNDLVDAAVPILRVLSLVAKQTRNQHFKEIILDMHKHVEDGGSLSEALAQHSDIFSSLYINMVKTGEVSGQLEVVLNRLADYLEKEQETRNKVISSLMYPGFILIVGFFNHFCIIKFCHSKNYCHV